MRQRENMIVEGDLFNSSNATSSYKIISNFITGLIFFFFSQNIFSQFTTPVFEYLSSEDGLPENSVTCILQDHLGYLWLGTQNGLVKYDGYTMKIFLPEKNDINSISNGSIVSILEDKKNVLWIGTANGLNKFNRITETFTWYKHNYNDTNSINNSYAKCIYEDRAGRFWVGTTDGLNLFERDKQIFTRYFFSDSESILYNSPIPDRHKLGVNAIIEEPGSENLLIGTDAIGLWEFDVGEKILSKYKFTQEGIYDEKIGRIQSFCISRDGKIWMASWHTLSSLDLQKQKFKSYLDFPILYPEKHEGSTCTHGSVIEDKLGLIWCGFWSINKGIFCLNPETEMLQQYKLYPDMPAAGSYNMVYSLFEDNSGIIWIGTWLSGLEKWNRRKYKFRLIKNDNRDDNSISDLRVYSANYDPRGFMWFGTGKALDKYNLRDGIYHHYLKNELDISPNVYTSIIDKSGNIWIGTDKGKLIKFNPMNKSYNFYCNDPKDSINLINKRILTLNEDHLGIIWIGTQNYGLYKFDIIKNNLIQYKHDPNDITSLSQNRVNIIFEDSFGTLWIGTNLGGLEKFDRNTGKFTYSGLNTIMEIFEDSNKNLWVADYTTGINLFDRKECEVTASYGLKDGLAHNAIQGILEDDHENLWIGTDVGLSKFSIEKRKFRNYTIADGLPANRFLWPSCKDVNGTMYFNTEAGLISFHPDSIVDDQIPPKVVLSSVSLFNRPDEKLDYKGFISELKQITLPYDQNDLRFDYVGLHFSEPLKNNYKYILENFDKDWVDAGKQRNATYTNLNPGEYVFRVKAANKDGIWNEEGASIKIIILPPLWATTWAYGIYTLIAISIIYFTWRLQLKRIRIMHDYEMSRFEAEKMHEVDEIKSRFFANISHEFRTPLTLIFGPAKDISEKTQEAETKKGISIIKRNATRLYGLVNQLLDLSKLEAGRMKLEACEQNIIPLLKGIFLSFTSFAERKKIKLRFNSMEENINVYIDKDKVEKITNNLLSNAFKFTPEGGKIEFTVEKLINEVEIKITDNGIGIPKERIGKIFDRFYQVDGSHTREGEGTGIGLALTKELVDLHKGSIMVESREGEGTTFRILMPLGKDFLKPEEIIEKESNDKPEAVFEESEPAPESYREKEETEIDILPDTDKPVLLIAEDNSDVRSYIISHLEGNYRIREAKDGEAGLRQALEYIPDLIISDVMMPKMDGFEMCSKIKTDERTSHIPVIMLTAKATREDKIEGYETGADDYIMKPFEPEELKARIRNLIEQRKRLHEHFKKNGIFELDQTRIASVDKKFLENVFNIITENIPNASFNVESLTQKLNLTRAVLHRKIVSLVGQPPVELIRRIRLTRAADLIQKKSGNISEIALDVGFNNPAYFSESFKKQFGITPSEYSQKFTKN